MVSVPTENTMADPFFKIFRVTAEDALKIEESPNDPHIHDFEELLIGAEGRIEHFIDYRSLEFHAPFVSFITRGKVHRIKPMSVEGKCDIWAIGFASDFIPGTTFQLYSYYHEHADIMIRDRECFDRMLKLTWLIDGEMKNRDPSMAVVRDLLKALLTMIEAESDKYGSEEKKYPKVHNTAFKNFLKILEENFRRPEGVSFYAEKLFMSSRNLNLLCQNILNQSVSELIETRRMTEAKNLLIYTDKSVSEIGFELGYNEKSYFTNVFKKAAGTTPTAFRDEMRKIIS